MRKALWILILLAMYAQANSQSIKLATTGVNTIYVGFNNYLSAEIKDYTAKDLLFSAEGLNIDTKSMIVNPDKSGNYQIIVSVRTKYGQKVVAEYACVSKYIPKPVATVANKEQGALPLRVFVAQLGVLLSVPGVDDIKSLKAQSYTVTVKRGEKVIYWKENTGAKFEREVNEVFSSIKENDVVTFSDIVCYTPDHITRYFDPLVFNITE